MAIYRLLQNSAFGPDEIKRMTKAYEDTLRALGLADRTDPITEIIAKKIIEVAQTGERDPLRIRARAIADLGIPTFTPDQDQRRRRRFLLGRRLLHRDNFGFHSRGRPGEDQAHGI